MTQLLVRLFVRGHDRPEDPAVRTAYGRMAGLVGICCNLLLFAGKLTAGFLAGSIAIMADALNNLSDASSNIVSLIGFQLGAKKADEEHPFGHARYEYLAGLTVSVMILAIGISLFKESLMKVISPVTVTFSWLSVGVLTGSILVKLWMSVFNRKIGETIHSDTLIATAADSRNDVITTAAVLAATFLVKFTGIPVIDGLMGLGVAVFILWSGAGLVKNTLSPLLGQRPDPALVRHIEEKILSYPGVLGVHDLMIHDYGPGAQFASIHIEFPAEANILEAHDLVDNIEREFMAHEHILLTIHYDPVVTTDAAVGEMRSYLSAKLKELEPKASMHDMRLVPGPTHTNVVFDLCLPASYKGDRAALVTAMKAAAKEKDPKYFCVIQLEHSFASCDPE